MMSYKVEIRMLILKHAGRTDKLTRIVADDLYGPATNCLNQIALDTLKGSTRLVYYMAMYCVPDWDDMVKELEATGRQLTKDTVQHYARAATKRVNDILKNKDYLERIIKHLPKERQ